MTPDEEWRTIPGYDIYAVSNLGRVKSIARTRWTTKATKNHPNGFEQSVPERLLRPGLSTSGYPQVRLYDADRRAKVYAVHRLVTLAFLGPRPEGMDVCHANDIKTDNRLENLRYDTRSENLRDLVRNGLNLAALRTHCPQGHAYDEANTRYDKTGRRRSCRACHAAAMRAHNARRRRELAN